MDINDSDKVNILLASLQERYDATHKIRARAEQICTWALGILVLATGFFVDKDVSLSLQNKIFFIAALFASFIVLRFFYLRDLEKGFKSQFRATSHIENILGLYEKNVYAAESVYPSSWQKSGQKQCDGKFFRSSYLLLYVGFVIIITSIILA